MTSYRTIGVCETSYRFYRSKTRTNAPPPVKNSSSSSSVMTRVASRGRSLCVRLGASRLYYDRSNA